MKQSGVNKDTLGVEVSIYSPERAIVIVGCFAVLIFAVVSTSTSAAWVQSIPASPTPRTLHATSPTATDTILLFGGYGKNGPMGDTWTLKSGTWKLTIAQENCHGIVCPSARYGHAMAFDPVRKRVVLFGGFGTGGRTLGYTWEWDGAQWHRMPSAGTAPPSRYRHAMAYTPTAGGVALFGGQGQRGVLGDLWVWNGVSWKRHGAQNPSAPWPSARSDHAMATLVPETSGPQLPGIPQTHAKTANPELVLFGGANKGNRLADTWLWNGDGWRSVTSPGGPPPRLAHAMGAVTDRVYLLGGDGVLGELADLWMFKQDTWTLVDATSAIGARSGHALIASPPPAALPQSSPRLTLFGGFGSGRRLGDTWAWEQDRWARRPSEVIPGARAQHQGAYDRARDEVVTFGGFGATGPLGDTWVRKAGAWSKQSPVPAPPARWAHALTYDADAEVVRLFGGASSAGAGRGRARDDFWEWDGKGWNQVEKGDSQTQGGSLSWPPARYAHALVHDPVSHKTLLFGGSTGNKTLGDIWIWDTKERRWSRDSASAPQQRPPGRHGHAMAFDEARGNAVLFGGARAGKLLDDTWLWNGNQNSWKPVAQAGGPAPAARRDHRMVYDRERKRVVLCGGLGKDGERSDCWQWDGAVWSQLAQKDGAGPVARRDFALIYDEWGKELVLFGGRGAGLFRDIWTLDSN